jgi:hypothetical protein
LFDISSSSNSYSKVGQENNSNDHIILILVFGRRRLKRGQRNDSIVLAGYSFGTAGMTDI